MRMVRRYSYGACYVIFDKHIHLSCQSVSVSSDFLIGWWMTLTDIYAGLWTLSRIDNCKGLEPPFAAMRSIFREWFESPDFLAAGEAKLTKLAIRLGCLVNCEGIAQLLKKEIHAGQWYLTQIKPIGPIEEEYIWSATCHLGLEGSSTSEELRGTLQVLGNSLLSDLSFGDLSLGELSLGHSSLDEC